MKLIKRILPVIILANICAEIDYTIIQSNENKLIFEVNLNLKSEDDLKPISLLIGLPNQEYPEVLVEYGGIYDISENWNVLKSNGIRWINLQSLQNLNVGTLQIDPKNNNRQYYKKIKITCIYNNSLSKYKSPNQYQKKLLKNRVINWSIAKKWIKPFLLQKEKKILSLDGQWTRFTIAEDGMYTIQAQCNFK
jgi:hypothetical protein